MCEIKYNKRTIGWIPFILIQEQLKQEHLQQQSSADSNRKGNISQQILKVLWTCQSGWGSLQMLSKQTE